MTPDGRPRKSVMQLHFSLFPSYRLDSKAGESPAPIKLLRRASRPSLG